MSVVSNNARSDQHGGRAKSPWIAGAMEPCDPEIFRAALEAWGAARQVPLRSGPTKGPGYALSDIPINRAAMGAAKFLRERGVAHPQAYLMRLMHMGDVFENAGKGGVLAKFVKPADEEGMVSVSEALLNAVALAPIPAAAGLSHAAAMLDIEAIRVLAETAWVESEGASGDD